MATIERPDKLREGLTRESALCKALGWFFPLLAKFRVDSVEHLVFRKFPNVCPYCRKKPHADRICKNIRGTAATLDHDALRAEYQRNWTDRPGNLDGWQLMFQDIYPRTVADSFDRSGHGLMEELGEMAEAIRVFDRYPKYFAGEAADVFSYLMGMANEYSLKEAEAGREDSSFQKAFLERFPGLCTQCGYPVCVCPSVPPATVGRLAKELDLGSDTPMFFSDHEAFEHAGAEASQLVLTQLGGLQGLLKVEGASAFPFDRGETNRALTVFCLQLAASLDESHPELAQTFRSCAVRAASNVSDAGARERSPQVSETVNDVLEVLKTLSERTEDPRVPTAPEDLAEELGRILQKQVRVLLVTSNPARTDRIRVDVEQREIEEALRRAKYRDRIKFKALPATRTDDFRRALLEERYDIVHFSGHATPGGALFDDDDRGGQLVALGAIAALLSDHPEVKCVILNGCESVTDLDSSMAARTVGMTAPLYDDAAIAFSIGFYDAIGAGRDVDEAINEGKHAVDLKGLANRLPIKVLSRGS